MQVVVPEWLITSIQYQMEIDRMTGELTGILGSLGKRTANGRILYRVELQTFDQYVRDHLELMAALGASNQAAHRAALEASCPDTF